MSTSKLLSRLPNLYFNKNYKEERNMVEVVVEGKGVNKKYEDWRQIFQEEKNQKELGRINVGSIIDTLTLIESRSADQYINKLLFH